MPKGASSSRYDSVRPSSANFVEPYSPTKGKAIRPTTDPMWSNNPLFCARIYGRAAWFTRQTPKTLVSNCCWTWAMLKVSRGPVYETPALFTTTSRRPLVWTTESMAYGKDSFVGQPFAPLKSLLHVNHLHILFYIAIRRI